MAIMGDKMGELHFKPSLSSILYEKIDRRGKNNGK